jgi:hypothetical protein
MESIGKFVRPHCPDFTRSPPAILAALRRAFVVLGC